MMVDRLIKLLILANHKVFIEIIELKDQRERLAFIKSKKDQQNVFLLCKAKYNSKVFW